METVYENYDGPYYLVVAKSWYDKATIGTTFSFPLPTEYYVAHFPFYPLLTHLANSTGLVTGPQAMVGVNVLFSVLSAITLYEIAKRSKWNNPLFLAIMWLFWWPRMWVVRSVGSPETVFALVSMLSLYFFDRKKYLLAGVAGSLALLTKSPGILLFASYGLWAIWTWVKTKKIPWNIWPVLLIPLTALGLFAFFQVRTGDFWAYFHSGDNIHLQALPFRVFDSSQAWVGDWWLEEVLWLYLFAGIGVVRAFQKNKVWGSYGILFYLSLLFVSHRDLGRYALPLVPVVLLGLSDWFAKKEVRIILLLALIPLYFFSLNFLTHNTVAIADWAPLL